MGRSFNTPWIHFNGMSAGDDVVIGGGTGQSTTDPYPCSFEDWKIMFEDDYDLDEDIDFDDYGTWWADQGFSIEDWDTINPGTPWNPNWES